MTCGHAFCHEAALTATVWSDSASAVTVSDSAAAAQTYRRASSVTTPLSLSGFPRSMDRSTDQKPQWRTFGRVAGAVAAVRGCAVAASAVVGLRAPVRRRVRVRVAHVVPGVAVILLLQPQLRRLLSAHSILFLLLPAQAPG